MSVFVKEPSAKSIATEFGLYPIELKINSDFFSVITLPEHESVIKSLKDHPSVDKGWIYAGPIVALDLHGNVRTKPYNCRIFDLPKTHMLELNHGCSQEHLNFVIWCLSFFTGMRLTTTQNGFLDATPIKPGMLVDFCVSGSREQDAIQVALNYLGKENLHPLECMRIAAVIHVLFLAQSPQILHFEKFQYLYMALDGCFRIMRDRSDKIPQQKKIAHAKQVGWVCERLGIQTPNWADGEDNIASIRNDSFHEAIFFGQPLGFSIFGTAHSRSKNILLQMQALICRFLVAMLGVNDASYISSSINSRENYLLKLK